MKALLDANVIITDSEVLRAVPPENCVKYLAENGWVPSFCLLHGGEVWSKPRHDELTQILVSHPKFTDHAARVGDFIRTVVKVDGIAPLRLLLQLNPGQSLS